MGTGHKHAHPDHQETAIFWIVFSAAAKRNNKWRHVKDIECECRDTRSNE